MTTQSELALLQVAFGIVIDEANTEIESADNHAEKWRNDPAIEEKLVEGTVGYARGVRYVKDRLKAFLDTEAERVEPDPPAVPAEYGPPTYHPPIPDALDVEWTAPPEVTINVKPNPLVNKVADKIITELKPKPINEIVWVDDEDVLDENALRRQRITEMLPFLKGNPGKYALLAEKARKFTSGSSFAKDFKGVTVAHRTAGKDDKGVTVYDLYVKWERK